MGIKFKTCLRQTIETLALAEQKRRLTASTPTIARGSAQQLSKEVIVFFTYIYIHWGNKE